MGEKAAARPLDGSNLRLAVVVSRFNEDVGSRLLKGALDALQRHGAPDPEVHRVPGAFELPLTALSLAESSRFDAIVCLGCLINGETAHFQFLAAECARGLMTVQLDTGVPCVFGVLTTFDRDQALARSGPKNNKGAEAAETAIEMANLLRGLQRLDEADTEEVQDAGEGGTPADAPIQAPNRPLPVYRGGRERLS